MFTVLQGFLEFSSHTEAKDMVTHYQTKPAFIKGQRISLCLSPTVEVIHVRTSHMHYTGIVRNITHTVSNLALKGSVKQFNTYKTVYLLVFNSPPCHWRTIRTSLAMCKVLYYINSIMAEEGKPGPEKIIK